MCPHMNFVASVTVNRIEKTEGGPGERYQADVRVECENCGTPFLFVGLPAGLDMNGAAVSVDRQEGRFTIAPTGEGVTPLEGVGGFTVKRVE